MVLRLTMRVPKYRLALWTAFVAALFFFIIQMRILPGTSPRTAQRFTPPTNSSFRLLDGVFQLIKEDYLDERDPLQTAEGAFRGMLNSLDPLSAYLNRDLTAQYLARSPKDKQAGLVMYKKFGSFPVVAGVIAGSPAEKAGVKVGDVLTAVDRKNTLNMSLTEVNLLFRGTSEGPVQAKFLRENDTIEHPLSRGVLFQRAYSFAPQAGRPAILRIHSFDPSMTAEIRKDVLPALKGPKKSLILDLRDCAEGDLDEARTFVNLFVKANSVGSFEKRGVKTPVVCAGEAPFANLPMAVWINQGTMGPAEFVAGVLQEMRKVKTIGLPTPGMVARVELFPLKDESAVLLTTMIFSLPSGRLLWDQGLTPDAAVQAKDQSEKAFLDLTLPRIPKL